MLYISSCIEQLHLAATQLHHDNVDYRRFSLILTDNIVELMAYRRCKLEFIRDEPASGIPTYSADERKKVLGNDFNAKVNFLTKLAILNTDKQTFISQCHGYRNESYHTGIVHDDILHAVAWHYHGLACDLFVRLRPAVIAWGTVDKVSATARGHIGEGGLRPVTDEHFADIARSLSRERPEPEPNLQDVLAASALNRIGRLQEAMDYLREDTEQSEADLIRDLQYWRAYADGHPSTQELSSEDADKVVGQWKEQMDTIWKPKYRSSPVPGYRKRAEALRTTPNTSNALQNFEGLKRNMESFEELVMDAADELSDNIQLQIDAARGK